MLLVNNVKSGSSALLGLVAICYVTAAALRVPLSLVAMAGALALLFGAWYWNLEVSGLDYFKVGIVVTPLMLVAGAVTIWLLLR